jgi:hypothetical protein
MLSIDPHPLLTLDATAELHADDETTQTLSVI